MGSASGTGSWSLSELLGADCEGQPGPAALGLDSVGVKGSVTVMAAAVSITLMATGSFNGKKFSYAARGAFLDGQSSISCPHPRVRLKEGVRGCGCLPPLGPENPHCLGGYPHTTPTTQGESPHAGIKPELPPSQGATQEHAKFS